MTSTSAFSSEDDVTKKGIDIAIKDAAPTDARKIAEVYELENCCKWIQENRFSRVALQFPDELLVDAVSAHLYLQGKVSPGVTTFILGDTSYGSCCVDEVAAEHYQADSIVHFGSACLSPTQRLPVLFVLCPRHVDVAQAAGQAASLWPDHSAPILLMADTMYHHALEPLAEHLQRNYVDVVTSYLRMPPSPSCHSSEEVDQEKADHATIPDGGEDRAAAGDREDNSASSTPAHRDTDRDICRLCFCNRSFVLPRGRKLEDYSVLYVGSPGKALTTLMMEMNKCAFFTYDPETRTARRETLSVSRQLMRRYYMIERAKDARIVGIVAGTLGVSGTQAAITHLQGVVRGAGKKSYTLAVGKVNVAKLANFLEVDVFVLVACPLNSLLDSKDFLQPIVTPFEMEVACNQARQWTGDYLTDFTKLLPGAAEHIPTEAASLDSTDVSLVTNKLRSLGQRSEVAVDEGSSAVVLRSDAMTVANVSANSAGEFLSSRSWQGLDPKLGETSVEKAKDGQSGIAMEYQQEPH